MDELRGFQEIRDIQAVRRFANEMRVLALSCYEDVMDAKSVIEAQKAIEKCYTDLDALRNKKRD